VSKDIFYDKIWWEVLLAKLSNVLILEELFKVFDRSALLLEVPYLYDLFWINEFSRDNHSEDGYRNNSKIQTEMIRLTQLPFHYFFPLLSRLLRENNLRILILFAFHFFILLWMYMMAFQVDIVLARGLNSFIDSISTPIILFVYWIIPVNSFLYKIHEGVLWGFINEIILEKTFVPVDVQLFKEIIAVHSNSL